MTMMLARARRFAAGATVLLVAAAFGAAVHAQGGGQAPERTIEIAVRKFEFIPPEITVRKGEPVRLALTAIDRVHGFSLKALGVRTDVKPDDTVVVRIVPDKVGTFVFACDIFCGDDHEDMQGVIKVVE